MSRELTLSVNEAREAGTLVEALDQADLLIDWAEDHDGHELLGVGFSFDHSDAGSSCGVGQPIVPRALAIAAIRFLRTRIIERLAGLGVRA